jgi:uncharacterized protein
MNIAILSDIHDNIWVLEKVLQAIESADAVIFCGDFCAPFSLGLMVEKFGGPIHCVAGNNDGDQWFLSRVAEQAGARVVLHGAFAELDLDGRRVFVNHYPPIAEGIAASGKYDLVCYGHDHQAVVRQVGNTLLVNPGEVMGRFGPPTYALYDTETGTAEHYEVRRE